jgi:hypothetical protein
VYDIHVEEDTPAIALAMKNDIHEWENNGNKHDTITDARPPSMTGLWLDTRLAPILNGMRNAICVTPYTPPMAPIMVAEIPIPLINGFRKGV